jgi:hypothetical protein
MTKDWYDSDNPTTVVRGFTWRAIIWGLVVFGVIAVVSIGVWGFRVATSDVAGRGNAVIIKNNAVNRIAQQERFEQLYADIRASDQKITVASAAVIADPSDKTAQQNLTGMQNYCLSVVGDYNALARKYSAEDFRSVDLPEQIDQSIPSTDCKE